MTTLRGQAEPPPSAVPAPDSATPPSVRPDGEASSRLSPGRFVRLRRFIRGRPQDPAWVRPSLLGLLLASALLYLCGLGASGWANSFYSAAAQAGSVSWKAFFYGSSDAASSITVDKTPASLWLTALSVRLFGLSSWSILVPQALAGVASVGALYATVRRWFAPGAAMLSGVILALTPVAVLMFRFNNPDALLILLLVLAAYATVRAMDKASAPWLILAGSLVGLGFLTKMLQALLVVPAFALVYLVAAPTSLGRRIRHLLLAGVALVVSAGWWVLIVQLVPASLRPYIGGSQNNSVVELMLGYNGLGRLTGNETGSVGGGGPSGWGETGWLRMFGADIGGQISWLLPAAMAVLVAGLVFTGRAPRTDRTRAAFLLWGGWLVVTALVFSFMQGIFHVYYTVALAPAAAALVGMGTVTLWRLRSQFAPRAVLAMILLGSAAWSATLLARSPDWVPWLRFAVLGAGVGAAALLLVGLRRIVPTAVVGVLGLAAVLAGPAAYAVDTATTPHMGAIPSAGPSVAGGFSGPGGFQLRTGQGGPGGQAFPGGQGGPPGQALPNGQSPPGGQALPNGQTWPGRQNSQGGQGFAGMRGPGGPSGGGAGGLLGSSKPSTELVALLTHNSSAYTWVAAAVGANSAAGYQLASGEPVMAIGGFNGSDPSPTLAQFKQYVADGKIHYFVGGGSMGGGMRSMGGSASAQEITAWVADTFSASTVASITVYDLTASKAADTNSTTN